MRILALDVGTVRIGLALSDPLGISAQPLQTLGSKGVARDVEAIAEIVQERGVETVVVGLPLSLNGHENEATERSRKLAEALETRCPELGLEFQDERFTTAVAEASLIEGGMRRKTRKSVVDQAAAVLILQAWLDQQGTA